MSNYNYNYNYSILYQIDVILLKSTSVLLRSPTSHPKLRDSIWCAPPDTRQHRSFRSPLPFPPTTLPIVEWSTPNCKLKVWDGKLDSRRKGSGLQKEGRCPVSGGAHQFKTQGLYGKLEFRATKRGLRREGRCLVSGGAHQILNSRLGMGSWTSEGKEEDFGRKGAV